MTTLSAPLDARVLPAPRPAPEAESTVPATTVPAPQVVTRPRGAVRALHPATDVALAGSVLTAVALADLVPASAAVLVATAWLLVLVSTGCYAHRPWGESTAQRMGQLTRSGARLGVGCWVTTAFVETTVSAPVLVGVVGALTLSAVPGALAARVVTRRPRLLLVGQPHAVRMAAAELNGRGDVEIAGACLTHHSALPMGELAAQVGLADAARSARERGAHAIVVLPGRRVDAASVRRLQWDAAGAGMPLYVGTGLLDVATRRTRVVDGGGLGAVHVSHSVLDGPSRWAKDVGERLAALLMLTLLAPALAVVALLIKLDSPGPVLFRQLRVGRDGRLFSMLKLRSMSVSAEQERTELVAANEGAGVLFKIRQDPRVTRVGRWLRRYSVDEVPQLWNVVTGSMSLVGPRPALPEEVARYDVDPRRRLAVKPGLTGLWQVSGRSDLTWEESVRLDLRYVDNWSLRLDLAILLRTARAVVDHRGAY